MKKTDRKTDNQIVKALNIVCREALDEVAGFQWITHFVRYNDFPDSLCIVCVFATREDLAAARAAQRDDYLRALIVDQLNIVGIPIRNIAKQLRFDSEEACREEHQGNWHERTG